MKNFLLTLLFVLICCTVLDVNVSRADPPGSPPPPPGGHGSGSNSGPAGAPIDGGLGILAALGLAYAAYNRVRDERKH